MRIEIRFDEVAAEEIGTLATLLAELRRAALTALPEGASEGAKIAAGAARAARIAIDDVERRVFEPLVQRMGEPAEAAAALQQACVVLDSGAEGAQARFVAAFLRVAFSPDVIAKQRTTEPWIRALARLPEVHLAATKQGARALFARPPPPRSLMLALALACSPAPLRRHRAHAPDMLILLRLTAL